MYDAFTWQEVAGVVQLAEDRLSVKVTEADLCGLDTPGSIGSDQRGLNLAFQIKAEQQSLEALTSCIGGQEEQITGRYDFAGSLETEGEGDKLARSVRGRIEGDATDGQIYGMRLAAQLKSFLSAATGNVRNVATLTEEGLAYDHLTLRAKVENSILQIEEATLEGPSVAWAAEGSVDLASRTLDLTFLVSALKTADSIVARIPIVGTVLGGSLVTYPVRVTGTLEEPKLKAVSA